MKKLASVCFALALLSIAGTSFVSAAEGDKKAEGKGDGKRPELTEEQKTLRKEMTAKYDTDKDGKLSKEEREKMSAEDKAKMAKVFPNAPKKKKD
ncbi:MAG TPA: hypothetical protein VK968_11715 [Roseimicrobium sp.]|nr:hypothetical protein [Roseimicrobium sp.]